MALVKSSAKLAVSRPQDLGFGLTIQDATWPQVRPHYQRIAEAVERASSSYAHRYRPEAYGLEAGGG